MIILGRQPKIGLAELESLYGADKLQPVGEQAVLIDLPPEQVDFSRLGGMVKFGKVLIELSTASWKEIEKYLAATIPKHLGFLPEGKLRLGLSVYGLDISPSQITQTGLKLKKVIQKSRRSARIVPNVENALNAAQVLHNKLNGPLGWELLLVKNGAKTILAQTIAVQDIEAYARRDQARPKRDVKVGMLPPKLAQIIINLAVGRLTANGRQLTVLDPFCGTGVVLQEALLMNKKTYGTDIEPRMIEYTKTNLGWLAKQQFNSCGAQQVLNDSLLEVADATSHTWKQKFDGVASETYLGRHFSAPPTPEVLRQVTSDVNVIIKKFLKNLARQTKPGWRLCLALPAWKVNSRFIHLPLLDSLEVLGYNRVSFVHASNEDLIYYRESQIVARELVTLIRK